MSESVEIFNYLSLICLAFSLVFIVVSVILFFKFKIRDAIYELSGKARVASTQKMQSGYSVTGSLRSSGLTGSGALSSSETSKSDDLNGSLMMTDRLKSKTQKTSPANTRQEQKSRRSGAINAPKGAGQTAKSKNSAYGGFKLTKDIIVVHTDERIVQ